MKNKIEYILCAAIYVQDGEPHEHSPKNMTSGYAICGRRHHNCINLYFTLTGKPFRGSRAAQGFITSLDRYVGRTEAAQIALDAGQITQLPDMAIGLCSEDLY